MNARAKAILARLLLAAAIALPAASPARAASTPPAQLSIPLAQLGEPGDIVLTGATPQFELSLPVYPELRGVRLRLPVTVASLVDPRSTLVVKVNGGPVFSTALAGFGGGRVLDIPLPVPAGARALSVAVGGHFFHREQRCGTLDSAALWVRVDRNAELVLRVDPRARGASVRDFMHRYAGDVTVVVAPGAGQTERFAAVGLAYALHQGNRWRQERVGLAPAPANGEANVIVAPSSTALRVRGDQLLVAPEGVPLLFDQLGALWIAPAVDGATAEPRATPAANSRTFEDLGFPTQTLESEDRLSFPLSLQLGRIGGVPSGLQVHLNLAHTPLSADDRADVRLLVNGTLAGSASLRAAGGVETFDFPVAANLLEATNSLRAIVTYFPNRPCDATPATMTASLLASSSISWSGVRREAPTVGDFFGAASGKLAVLVGDPELVPAAFALVEKLGAENTTVTSIDVRAFDGTIPAGYDYAIVVAPPASLAALDLAFRPGPENFTLAAPAQDAVRGARFDQPLGALQTTLSGPPALVLTYWKSSSALAALATIPSATLAGARGSVALFDRNGVSYISPPPERFGASAREWIRITLEIILALAAGLAVYGIAMFFWRRRRI